MRAFFKNIGAKKVSFLAIFLLLLFIALKPGHKAQAFIVTPLQQSMAADPGTSVGGTFSVYNDTDKTQTFYTSVENFESDGETGNPRFVDTKVGLVQWVSMPASVSAAPRENAVIPFTITVPKGADPGGYFAGLFASTQPPSTSANTNLAIGNKIGMLLLFRANGNISESISIVEFGTNGMKRFFTMLPIDFYYRFQNSGADAIEPLGDVIIENIFGQQTKILNANQDDGHVLPQSIRRFDAAWVEAGGTGNKNQPVMAMPTQAKLGFFSAAKMEWQNFAFGLYTAHLNLAYGYVTQQSATANFRFFIFPWQLILIEVVVLIILLLIFRIFFKRYNRYIIRQSEKLNNQPKTKN